MKAMVRGLAGFLILLGMVAAGCGYQFRVSGEPQGIDIESLAIPLFSSTSSELGFEADFTRVIRNEFISHARVPLVAEEKAAKVIVGKIFEIRTSPVTYGSRDVTVGGQVATYEVTRSRNLSIRLDVQLLDRREGTVVWRDQSMTASSSFAVAPDPMLTRYNERVALERIARSLAKMIYLKTMERF